MPGWLGASRLTRRGCGTCSDSEDDLVNYEAFNNFAAGLEHIVTIVALIVGGLWAYTRYVLERGLLPPAELEVTLTPMASTGDTRIIEVGVKLKNLGTHALITSRVSARILYLNADEPILAEAAPASRLFGRVRFPHVLRRDISGNATDSSEFILVPHHTFVQPGVLQTYSFVTVLPQSAKYVLVHAEFDYEARPSRWQARVLRVARKLGFVQYTLQHATEAHTAERVFLVGETPMLLESSDSHGRS